MSKFKKSVVSYWRAMHRPLVIKGKAPNPEAINKANAKRIRKCAARLKNKESK